jgi:hypothetical protein
MIRDRLARCGKKHYSVEVEYNANLQPLYSETSIRYGLNLNTQERNQELARYASITDELATVDFSSASDTISYELVRELLPPDWFHLLCIFRSDVGSYGEDRFHWQKFSSMGNVFTFELETLIFHALALVVTREAGLNEYWVNTFGDDVILPGIVAQPYLDLCTLLGFTANTEKTFVSGHFRESCGSYWYDGLDIKPIHLKEGFPNVEALYKLANSVRRYAHRISDNTVCDIRFKHCWLYLYTQCPKSLRFQIPEGFGDIGFIDNFDVTIPKLRKLGCGWEGYSFPALRTSSVTRIHEGDGMLLARLKNRSIDRAANNAVDSKSRTTWSVAKATTESWYNLGPWI